MRSHGSWTVVHVGAFIHAFTIAYVQFTVHPTPSQSYAFICTLMNMSVHTCVFRVAPVLSDPWTKDLVRHRMAMVTQCKRAFRDRLTEAAYGRNCCSALETSSPKEQPGLG